MSFACTHYTLSPLHTNVVEELINSGANIEARNDVSL